MRANIKVLVVDGFSNHSVEKTTQKILDILASDPSFEVTVSTMPAFNTDGWSTWKPNFAAYDVIVQTCNNINNTSIAWPDKVKSDLESYIGGGGGMYVYHSGNNAFPDWPEYNKMIGMGWRAVDYGQALQIKDGQVVEIPAGVGERTRHGPRFDAVFNRFGNHPIHANLPPSWKSTDVEVYSYTRGPIGDLTVLSYAREPVNDIDFPTEWVVQYGAGRTYTSTYGHYWKDQENPPGVQDVAFQTLMMRALQWLAKKPVTQTVPVNFPTSTTVSMQNTPPPVSIPVTASGKHFVYAALLSNNIEIYAMNSQSGKLTKVDTQETPEVPFYLKLHPTKKYLYVGLRGKTHGIASYAIDQNTGRLTFMNKVDLEAGPVHIGIDKTGQYLFTAPWQIEKVSMSRLANDGRLMDVKYFSTGKNPHAFEIDPTNHFLFVPCLGSDHIEQYQFDAQKGTVKKADPFLSETKQGAGPRLPIFHSWKNIMYQGNEKDDTITAYTMDVESGDLSSFQTISTVPDGYDGKSNLSELHLTPNGKFLYIANRGHNSIVGYEVDTGNGKLRRLGFYDVGERTIRSFSIEPSGNYLYAAGQKSGDLVTFSINQRSGALTQSDVVKAGGGIGMVIAEEL
ncbi:MAG: beta-propeller fold lactonase family protein [Verrucomicrobia bacterium]|nr:beta-propeller fold lactonase family protein [Verrucomicrobiota bacterium]